MSYRALNRVVVLTVAKPFPNEFFGTQPNATVIKDLRVTFTIRKTLDKSPNTCEAVIYNLAESTRRFIASTNPLHVQIDAGYPGALQRMFTGDVRFSMSTQVGPDWVTKMQLGDGHRAIKYGHVNKSYRAGVNAKTIITDTATVMGLKVPKSAADAVELLTQYSTGATVHGPAHQVMTDTLEPRGLTWSVQDGELQILRSSDVKAGEAVLVSEAKGMIGSPQPIPPSKPGAAPRLSVQCLLDSRIKPGVKVRLESRWTNGTFKCEAVEHVGDAWEGDMMTTAELKAI